jgi:hypothetical protein
MKKVSLPLELLLLSVSALIVSTQYAFSSNDCVANHLRDDLTLMYLDPSGSTALMRVERLLDEKQTLTSHDLIAAVDHFKNFNSDSQIQLIKKYAHHLKDLDGNKVVSAANLIGAERVAGELGK